MFDQLIINPSGEVNQRAAATYTNSASGTYTVDRWMVDRSSSTVVNPTIAISQETSNLPSNGLSISAIKLNITASGTATSSGYWCLRQAIEDYNYLKGKTVSLSVQIQAPSGSQVVDINIFDGIKTNLTSRKTLTTSYSIYKFEGISISSNATKLHVNLIFANGTATKFPGSSNFVPATGAYYVSQVQFNVGEKVLDFKQKRFLEELTLCQRYYEKSYNYSVAPGTASDYVGTSQQGFLGGSSGMRGVANFKVTKYRTPDMTFYDTAGTAGKCNWPDTTTGKTTTFIFSGLNSAVIETPTAGVADSRLYFHWIADAEMY